MSECVNNNQNTYEHVNHPSHYNNYDVEVIEMMKRIWGIESTIMWCEMTAFKYRMRMGTKPGNTIEQDLKKEKWYLDKKKELSNEYEDEVLSMVEKECSQYISQVQTPVSTQDGFVASIQTKDDIEFFATNSTDTTIEYIREK